MIAMHLLVILEGNLARCHGSILEEIRPWRVYDGNIVLLVA